MRILLRARPYDPRSVARIDTRRAAGRLSRVLRVQGSTGAGKEMHVGVQIGCQRSETCGVCRALLRRWLCD